MTGSGVQSEQGRSEDETVRDEIRREDRQRMLQNLAALAFIVVFVLGSGWVLLRVADYSRNMACIESGHRSCR